MQLLRPLELPLVAVQVLVGLQSPLRQLSKQCAGASDCCERKNVLQQKRQELAAPAVVLALELRSGGGSRT